MNTDFLFRGGCFLPNLEAASAFIQKNQKQKTTSALCNVSNMWKNYINYDHLSKNIKLLIKDGEPTWARPFFCGFYSITLVIKDVVGLTVEKGDINT